MGPLIPIALGAVAVYGLKRFFDTKQASGAQTPVGPPIPGDGAQAGVSTGAGASGGGGGGPYNPGYPMSTDPSYNPAPAQPPKTMGQIASMLKAVNQPRVMTSQTAATAAPNTLGTMASRAASIPSTYLASGPAPAPAPKTLSSLGKIVTGTPIIIKPGSVTGKTF